MQPELAVDLEAARGNLRETVEQEPVQQEIHRRFVRFLHDFRNENGELVYQKRIQDMCSRKLYPLCLRPPCPSSFALPGVAPAVLCLGYW